MPFKGGIGKRRKRSAANKALDATLAAAEKPASKPASTTAPASNTTPAVNVLNVGSA